MDFEEAINKRRAVREFLPKQVPDEIVRQILELGNLSPSAGNLQARKVLVVKDSKIKNQIAEAAGGQNSIATAPVVLVICADPEASAVRYAERGRNLYCVQDATIFTAYAQLAAVNLGLATCWVGAFDEEQVKKILSLPKNLRPVAILPLGYQVKAPEKKPRKSLNELAEFR